MNLLNFVLSILFILLGVFILKYWTKDSIKESWGSIFNIYLGGIALVLVGVLMFYIEIRKLFN